MSAVLKPTDFASLSVPAQRLAICNHILANEYDAGLVSESIGEHPLHSHFMKAFHTGDLLEMGRLADQMIREYMGPIVEREWDL
jgi:hypothetical protein